MLASLQPFGIFPVGIDFLIIFANTCQGFCVSSCASFGRRRLVEQEKGFSHFTVEALMKMMQAELYIYGEGQ